MADLLNTGISALLGYRKALDTAGHNIANVSTEGYTRQRVEFVSRLGGPQGDGYIGAGVSTSTVKRITDAFVGARIVADTSAYARAQSFEGVVGQLDTWLSDATTGLAGPLTSFFDSLNDLSANPSSTADRQSVISDAQSLATRFHSLASQIDGLQTELNARVRQDVDDINAAARDIAALNERIATATGAAGGQPPNDLLDQRDQLIQQLAGKIGITTTQGDDGSISVFAGNGQGLVIGTRAASLGVTDDVYGSGRLDITFNGIAVTSQIGGGSLGGLLDAQREVIDPARAKLGRIAVGLTEAFNTQHRLGVDATGAAGGDFFTPLTGTVSAARTNGVGADIDLGFADVSQLRDAEYELSFDGASWSLRNLTTGASVAMAGDGSSGNPFTADGLSITVSGAANAGDRWSLQPTARAAADIAVAITDPARLAAAAAGSGANSSDNTNVRALLGLGTQGLLDGGRSSIVSANTSLVSGVGNQARQASVARGAQESLLAQSIAARDATSGVNLDEEAADLVRFQQAYQAAAQVIAVADTVFQTLLDATRR